MATKKQKRAAALAKREVFLQEEKERGLAALQQSQQQHADNIKKALETNKTINDSNREALNRSFAESDARVLSRLIHDVQEGCL